MTNDLVVDLGNTIAWVYRSSPEVVSPSTLPGRPLNKRFSPKRTHVSSAQAASLPSSIWIVRGRGTVSMVTVKPLTLVATYGL
jgi:hypothetical protein